MAIPWPAISIGPVLLAGFVSFILGAIWYSPLMFTSAYQAAIRQDKKNPTWGEDMYAPEKRSFYMIACAQSLIGALVQSYVMAYVLGVVAANGFFKADGSDCACCQAMLVAGWIFIGIVFPASFMDNTFALRPFTLAAIQLGDHLVHLLSAASILYYLKAFTPASIVANTVPVIGWKPVLAAVLVRFMLGGLWYSEALFGKKWVVAFLADKNDPAWMKWMGQQKYAVHVAFGGALIGYALQTMVLGVFISWANVTTVLGAIKLSLLLSVGFLVPYSVSDHTWSERPFILLRTTLSHHIVSLCISAAFLVLF